MPNAHITGWGIAVPERVMTNHEIAKMVDTTDEWIQERTGIKERRIAGEGETTASLATQAALHALEVANLLPQDLELIICSTSSPEHIFPATACLVQDRLGAPDAGAFDLSAACTGFLFAMNMAAQSIRSGSIKNALVIGSETLSRIVNWEDRSTCILFGDGAGAFVIQASEAPGGIQSAVMHSDGSGGDLLSLPAGGSKIPASLESVQAGLHFVQMNGREVYRFATRVMASATREALAGAGWTIEDLQLVIPHQANKRIIEAAARGLDISLDRVVVNVDHYGNTSTASIPLATVEAVQQGRLKQGDKVVFVGFGGGLTWGAMAVEWSGPILPKREVYPTSYRVWVQIRSWLLRLVRHIEGVLWGRDINR